MLKDDLAAALAAAIREKNKVAVSALRLALAAVRDLELTARTQDRQTTPQEGIALLRRMVQQRRELARVYTQAGHEDRAHREESEVEVLLKFLPQELDDAALEAVLEEMIRETSAESLKDIGRVMAGLREQYAGQVDMKRASELARRKLGD